MTTYNQPPQNHQFLVIFCICFSTQRIYLVISGGYETCTNQNRSYIADKKSVVHSPKPITSRTIEIPLVSLAFDGRVAKNNLLLSYLKAFLEAEIHCFIKSNLA